MMVPSAPFQQKSTLSHRVKAGQRSLMLTSGADLLALCTRSGSVLRLCQCGWPVLVLCSNTNQMLERCSGPIN